MSATHACKAGGWKCGRFRDEARWSGRLTQHCTVCGELFLGERAADMHSSLDKRGDVVCHDPLTRMRRNGIPMFEKVPKSGWDPPYAWREFRPDLPEHFQARERRNLRTPGAVPGTRSTPNAQTGAEIAASPSEGAA